jgi:vacuolar-type H+-ATPase subunit H
MQQNDTSTSSFLERVASHERNLQLEVDAAEKEAESIVEYARTRCRELTEEREQALAREIIALDEETDDACRVLRRDVLQTAEKRLAGSKADIASRIHVAVEAVTTMVLPRRAPKGEDA